MRKTYNPNVYQPRLGGHAPGHLRDAFALAVEAYEAWNDGSAEPTVLVGHEEIPMKIGAVAGLLCNCTDIMGSFMCRDIDDLLPAGDECRSGSTYAIGARHLKKLVGKRLS
jgi:hypothetical protein